MVKSFLLILSEKNLIIAMYTLQTKQRRKMMNKIMLVLGIIVAVIVIFYVAVFATAWI